MGKNKPKKNIFKVAGAQSLKSKNKAKSVNLNLKKIVLKTKEKIVELNNDLVEVRPMLSNPPAPKEVKRQTPLIVISQPPLTQQDENETLNQLGELQCK